MVQPPFYAVLFTLVIVGSGILIGFRLSGDTVMFAAWLGVGVSLLHTPASSVPPAVAVGAVVVHVTGCR